MAEKCGKCESTNLEPRDHDLWHYMRNCKDCGARTRYNSRGKVVWVKGGKEVSKEPENKSFNYNSIKKDFLPPFNITGRLENFGGSKYIQDSNGNRINSIDQFGNVKDNSGNIKGFIDSFGNIKDSSGNITGHIDSFGNIHKK